MTISDEELDELERLLEKATPGEWYVYVPDRGYTDTYIGTKHQDYKPDKAAPHRNYVGETGLAGGQIEHRYTANADLIAFLRNLAPRLLSHYRSARNDGIEEAARAIEEYANTLKSPHVSWAASTAVSESVRRIRALKSPPQSEPGTEE